MQTVLVTVDALRADCLSQYGYHRDTMPVLDQLTETGTVFENAYANAPYTRVSIPSFHTSRYLAYEQLESVPTIASVLSECGVTTAAIGTQTGIGLVDGDFRFDELIDLGRDAYHEEANASRPLTERVTARVNDVATTVSKRLQRHGADRLYDSLRKPYNAVFGDSGFRFLGYTSAEHVTDRANEWLAANADSEFFLWIHYMEAHRPYGVHDTEPAYLDESVDEERIKSLMKQAGLRPGSLSEEERALNRDLYDSDVRFASRHIDRLFDTLRDLGIWDDASVLLSSDHGEEFGDHGRYFHRNYPYEELTHVPLVVKSPAVEDAPDRVDATRELVDLLPTICAFHGVDPAGTVEGEHLFEGDSRRVFSLGQPRDASPAVALRTDEWTYITNDETTQLYDRTSDRTEQDDLAGDRQDVVARLDGQIPPRLRSRDVNAPRAPDDEIDREHLEALGYMELRE